LTPSSRMPLPSSQMTSSWTPRDSSSRAVSTAVGGGQVGARVKQAGAVCHPPEVALHVPGPQS
jgi:hypothetical protein